jgi:hypothetical protein
MTRSTIRSYSILAALAFSSLFSYASGKPANTQTASAPPKTEQICQVHPEYSCVEVPTVYGLQSSKQTKEQKASAREASQKDAATRPANSAGERELNFRSR